MVHERKLMLLQLRDQESAGVQNGIQGGVGAGEERNFDEIHNGVVHIVNLGDTLELVVLSQLAHTLMVGAAQILHSLYLLRRQRPVLPRRVNEPLLVDCISGQIRDYPVGQIRSIQFFVASQSLFIFILFEQVIRVRQLSEFK